jgi:hypothetical protein
MIPKGKYCQDSETEECCGFLYTGYQTPRLNICYHYKDFIFLKDTKKGQREFFKCKECLGEEDK